MISNNHDLQKDYQARSAIDIVTGVHDVYSYIELCGCPDKDRLFEERRREAFIQRCVCMKPLKDNIQSLTYNTLLSGHLGMYCNAQPRIADWTDLSSLNVDIDKWINGE